MEELDLKKLEHIPVPEGLEARLEAMIDEWAKGSSAATPPRKGASAGMLSRRWRIAGAAASVALLVTAGVIVHKTGNAADVVPAGRVDTYHDPQLAYEEAERALNLLAANINRCQQELGKVESVSRRSRQIFNKSLKIAEE